MSIFQRERKKVSSESDLFTCFDNPSDQNINRKKIRSSAISSRSEVAVKSASSYGIQDAIELMRNLSEFDQKIIVAVVKQTLESADIKVSDIIVDGDYKESAIRSQIDALTTEVEEFRSEISKRTQEIDSANLTLDETIKVNNLLKLAQKSQIKEQLSKTSSNNSAIENAKTNSATSTVPTDTGKSKPSGIPESSTITADASRRAKCATGSGIDSNEKSRHEQQSVMKSQAAS
jgi:hypothetical protein